MKTTIVLNPNAGSADQADVVRAWAAARAGVRYCETERAGDAARLAREAVAGGAERVVAAGGDGSINEVLNGIMRGGQAQLGIVPLGTGNDLATLLDVPADPAEALALLDEAHTATLDVVEVLADGMCSFCINAAAGGFSGQVDEAITAGMKRTWGPFAYLMAAARQLPDLTGYETRIAYDDGALSQVSALNVVVANGRTIGGGKRVAPLADPTDGLIDVVVVEHSNLLDLAAVGTLLMTGNYLESPFVHHRRVRHVTVASSPRMWFNVDGELLTNETVSFRVLPAALDVVVGPNFRAEPDVPAGA